MSRGTGILAAGPTQSFDHGLEGEPDHVDRRLVGQRDDIQTLNRGVGVVEGEQGQQPRDLDPVHHGVAVVPAQQVLGGPAGGGREPLERGQLGWACATSRAAQSPTTTCSGEATAAAPSEMEGLASTTGSAS